MTDETDTPLIPDVSSDDIKQLAITDIPVAREVFRDFDEFRRYRVQTGFETFEKFGKYLQQRSALFEKLVLVNGATIALSITFLASLSSHLANSPVKHPPLWMVGASWVLLLLSTYCCYRYIVAMQGA